ncbi:MAG: hypothetical protein CMB43_03285 [Euryarchaeota archaeon]|nr:hypothetical protein [Euryarchaeota archaeon]
MNMRFGLSKSNRIVCIATPYPPSDTVMNFSDAREKITHLLDVLGFYCPVPLHETKKALRSLSTGDVIGVRADDPETLHDIPMFLDRTQHILHDVVQDRGEFCFIIEVSQ